MKEGLKTVRVIKVSITRDEAAVVPVDSNLNHEHILLSEKAFVYKLKMEVLARQPGRLAKNTSQVGTQKRTDQIMAEESGESRNQIQRHIRLTHPIPNLLCLADEERIG